MKPTVGSSIILIRIKVFDMTDMDDLYLHIMKTEGATDDEINRMEQYINARNALVVTRKSLGIDTLMTKYIFKPYRKKNSHLSEGSD